MRFPVTLRSCFASAQSRVHFCVRIFVHLLRPLDSSIRCNTLLWDNDWRLQSVAQIVNVVRLKHELELFVLQLT